MWPPLTLEEKCDWLDEKVSTERFEEMQEAVRLLNGMTSEERQCVFGLYCHACGRADPNCQCWNDE